MKKMMSLGLGILALTISMSSCKKQTTFEKGKVVCNVDGKSYTSDFSANASYIGGILTIGSQGKVGSEILPTQIMFTFEEGTEGSVGNSENMVFSGSKGTDAFASHWDNELVGSVSGTIETINESECKGTFEATVKTQSGSKTFKITEGKFWLDI